MKRGQTILAGYNIIKQQLILYINISQGKYIGLMTILDGLTNEKEN